MARQTGRTWGAVLSRGGKGWYLCGMERDMLHLGDCMEGLRSLPDGSVDAVITDPPYGITCCKWDVRPDLPALFSELWRVLKPNGAIAMFAQQPFATDCINASRREFRYDWVWEKTAARGFLNANRMPLRCHEDVLMFYRHIPTYNPQMAKGKPYEMDQGYCGTIYRKREKRVHTINDGTRYPRDVIRFKDATPSVAHGSVGRGNATTNGTAVPNIHPTQKPLPLLEYLIKTYTNEGDLVVDPYMGSGTTAVAALRTGRHFIGWEKEGDYHAKALARIEAARAELAGKGDTP